MTAHARIEAFARAADALSAHCDAGVRGIGLAMSAWLGGAAPKALEAALGLKPVPGCRSARTAAAFQRRDGLVREMATRFFPNMKHTRQADHIFKVLSRYAGGADWRKDKAVEKISYRETIRGHCWALLREVDTPLSKRRIRAILAAS